MKHHFEDNPEEKKILLEKGGTNCKELQLLKNRSVNLAHLPDYL